MSENLGKPDSRLHDFGWAKEKMQEGLCVERECWSRRRLVFLREGRTIDHVEGPLGRIGVTEFVSCPHFCMLLPGGYLEVGWRPLPGDLLAFDWRVSEGPTPEQQGNQDSHGE